MPDASSRCRPGIWVAHVSSPGTESDEVEGRSGRLVRMVNEGTPFHRKDRIECAWPRYWAVEVIPLPCGYPLGNQTGYEAPSDRIRTSEVAPINRKSQTSDRHRPPAAEVASMWGLTSAGSA